MRAPGLPVLAGRRASDVLKPWILLAEAEAPDGERLTLHRRAHEFRIDSGGRDLMSSEDDGSSRALAELGCAGLPGDRDTLVLVGGLGMGFTLRAALDATGSRALVEVAEFVPAVAQWNEGPLAQLAGAPLLDPRAELRLGDVGDFIRAADRDYDAILLDVDNGPTAHAHQANDSLYSTEGIAAARAALRPGGVFGVWSFGDDARFTRRLERGGFAVQVHKVAGSRKGRGKHHRIWIARRQERR